MKTNKICNNLQFLKILHIFKVLVVFAAFTLSFSCTQVGIGYRFGSGQIRSKISDSFQFEPSQKSRKVDFALTDHFLEQKKPVLKKIKSTLQEIQIFAENDKSFSDKISIDQINLFFLSFKKSQKELVSMFEPSFKIVIENIGSSEIKHFESYIIKQFDIKDKEALDENDFKNQRQKSFKRILTFLFDDLNPDQMLKIEKFVSSQLLYYKHQLKLRREFSQQFIKLYPNKEKMISHSLAYYSGESFSDCEPCWTSKDQITAKAKFETDLKLFLQDFLTSLNKDQRGHLRSTLKDLISSIDSALE